MESTEIQQAIRVLEANIQELTELVDSLQDPLERGKVLCRLIDQNRLLLSLART
jgi:hypothetical protein